MPKVREAIALIQAHGWRLARMRGSHRHYKHPARPGTVTIAANLGRDIKPGTWRSILRQAGIEKGR